MICTDRRISFDGGILINHHPTPNYYASHGVKDRSVQTTLFLCSPMHSYSTCTHSWKCPNYRVWLGSRVTSLCSELLSNIAGLYTH